MKPPEGDAKDLGLLHRLSLTGFGASNTKTEEERWTLMYNESRGKDMKKDHLWEIKSLDLVGLVMHETPTVYVSAQIPAMKDLKKRPTREMDVFEMEGLEDLVSGKPLYIRSKDETLRVLGPITAAKACLKCHGDAKEGDMLGAFSYTLRRAQYVVNGRGLSGQPLGEGFVAPPMKGPGYPVTPKK